MMTLDTDFIGKICNIVRLQSENACYLIPVKRSDDYLRGIDWHPDTQNRMFSFVSFGANVLVIDILYTSGHATYAVVLWKETTWEVDIKKLALTENPREKNG